MANTKPNKRATREEKEIYLRDVLGLKKIIRKNGRPGWIRDESVKSKLQFGAGVVN
jgi:hypothetical protein